jgi:hypothetical protein
VAPWDKDADREVRAGDVSFRSTQAAWLAVGAKRVYAVGERAALLRPNVYFHHFHSWVWSLMEGEK